MSDVNRIRGSASGGNAGSAGRADTQLAPRAVAVPERAASVPSATGTAVLNLSEEQTTGIRSLLIGLRSGGRTADDVRKKIIGLLSGSQRRMLEAAYFIISVRV